MNAELISQLKRLASIIDRIEEGGFRAEAYRRAAASIAKLDYKINRDNCPNLTTRKIAGIGAGIVPKITEYLERGKIALLSDLESRPEIRAREELGKIVGVGPATLTKWIGLGIYSRGDLWRAINAGKVQLTSAQAIGLRYYEDLNARIPRALITEIFTELKQYLPSTSTVAGSYRRGAADSGDIDIIVCGQINRKGLLADPRTAAVILDGDRRISIVFCVRRCVQVDILITPRESYYASLQYFTGSADHNEYVRGVAKKKGYRLNEKGLFRVVGGKLSPVKLHGEETIYKTLGLEYMPPESR